VQRLTRKARPSPPHISPLERAVSRNVLSGLTAKSHVFHAQSNDDTQQESPTHAPHAQRNPRNTLTRPPDRNPRPSAEYESFAGLSRRSGRVAPEMRHPGPPPRRRAVPPRRRKLHPLDTGQLQDGNPSTPLERRLRSGARRRRIPAAPRLEDGQEEVTSSLHRQVAWIGLNLLAMSASFSSVR